MERKTSVWIFRILFLLYIGAVAYLCFANFHDLPKIEKSFFGIPTDKIVHFCMFFPFPILASFAFGSRSSSIVKVFASILAIAVVGALFAAFTEIVQGYLTYRSRDILDFRTDLLALGISTFAVIIFKAIKARK